MPIWALIAAAALLAPLLISTQAQAAEAQEITALRGELQELRAAYAARIDALEQRLAQAEARAAAQPAAASAATARAPAGGEGAFNPALSLVLAGTYTRLTQDPQSYRIQGYRPVLGDIAPPGRGFALGESELSLAANIDNALRGTFTASVAPSGGSVEVEEANIQSLGLGNGLGLKAGRFLSGIGYLNAQHAHAWDFADAPLAYQVFLGNQLKNDGVQARWLAPTDLAVELGAEVASARDKNGASNAALYGHVGGDLGLSHSWRGGLSYLSLTPRGQGFGDQAGTSVQDAFSGRSRLWIADLVWKWAPNGNASQTSLILQGEAMRRNDAGTLSSGDTASRCYAAACAYDARQSGWYAQAVWQFLPRLRLGLRHDALEQGRVAGAADFPLLGSFAPRRDSLMFDYSPSEFSRFRLQLARAELRPGASDNQAWLQYLVSMGAHGAHRY